MHYTRLPRVMYCAVAPCGMLRLKCNDVFLWQFSAPWANAWGRGGLHLLPVQPSSVKHSAVSPRPPSRGLTLLFFWWNGRLLGKWGEQDPGQLYRPKFKDLRKYLILWAKYVCTQKKKSKNQLIFQGQALETVKGCAKVRKNQIIMCMEVPVFLFFCRHNA